MAKSNSSDKTVTRVKATGSKKSKKTSQSSKVTKSEEPSAPAVVKDLAKKPERKYPLVSFLGYFKGAWQELRQVRWPSRGATWSLTGAVLIFAAFFIVFIALIDGLFNYIFELILK